MENYIEKERLGKGAQGSVYLVESKIDRKKYVLKKVECNDESEANQAFREASALKELNHPYICGYKEFFVYWDKQESSMYVGIIMDHYSKGDLDTLMKKHRKEKKAIDEKNIKKWLGIIIEVLVFINEKNVIHRDLKPSNLFIKDDDRLALGDFGVATVMGDCRTKTRTAVGSMNWMAPEVLERPYDERSDIWSLGCITLEMMTCGFMTALEMSKALSEIKIDPEKLEKILEKASESYSKELIAEIRQMLRRNFEQRPNAKKLCESPFIADCMALSGSALVDRKRRQEVKTDKNPLPTNKGVPGVIEYLKKNSGHENCVREAMEWLATEVKNHPLDEAGKLVVAKALRQNAVCGRICIAGCNIFSNSILSVKETDIVYTEDVFGAVVLAMKYHLTNAEIQQAAAAFLMTCSSHGSSAAGIGECGGIQCLLEAMRSHPKNIELLCSCCNALWSLCVNDQNATIATKEQAMSTICSAMRRHADSPELLENAIAALLSLSMEDDNVEQADDQEVMYLLLSSLKTHIGHSKLAKNACMTLASFVEADEECALVMIDCQSKNNPKDHLYGITLLMETYSIHHDNVDVVEAIASVMTEIVAYDDVADTIPANDSIVEKIRAMRRKYLTNKSISKACEDILKHLTVKGKS